MDITFLCAVLQRNDRAIISGYGRLEGNKAFSLMGDCLCDAARPCLLRVVARNAGTNRYYFTSFQISRLTLSVNIMITICFDFRCLRRGRDRVRQNIPSKWWHVITRGLSSRSRYYYLYRNRI